jgi:DNA repair exonuclease SbcCD ATPase subunit
MSNFTRLVVSAEDPQALQQECSQRLGGVFSDAHDLAEEVNLQLTRCQQMNEQYAMVLSRIRSFQMSLTDLGDDFKGLDSSLRKLSQDADGLNGYVAQAVLDGQAVLRDARTVAEGQAADQEILHTRLESTARQTQEFAVRLAALTNELEKQMQAAREIADQVSQVQTQHTRLDLRLDQQIDLFHQEAQALQGVLGQWQGVSAALSRLNQNILQKTSELQALRAAADSTPALYSMLECLRDFEFERLETFPGGLQAFFVDEQQRRVVVTSTKMTSKADQLLDTIQLVFDLDGFDAEGQNRECDRQLEILLDQMTGLVIRERSTQSPRRAPKGRAQAAVAARQVDRNREGQQT